MFQTTRNCPSTPNERERHVLGKLRLVSPFLIKDSCLMETGAGDCLFSINAASHIRRGVVGDVSKVIVSAAETVANLDIVVTDGVSLPVEPDSVDVAYSDCITLNRVSGPHDVSQGFDEVATGFHLREYTGREIRALLLEADFRKMDFYAGGRGQYIRMPTALALLAESLFDRVPKTIRTHIPSLPQYLLFGLNVVATR